MASNDQDDVKRPFQPGPACPRDEAVPIEHRPLGQLETWCATPTAAGASSVRGSC
jgi:hypothetical protein